MRFVVSVLFGFVAEIATGLVIGAGMFLTTGKGMPASPADFPPWVPYVSIVAGAFFTGLIARWRAVRDVDRAMLHALLVAIAAVGLHLATSVGVGRPFTYFHAIADICKLGAGVTAGMSARRRVLA